MKRFVLGLSIVAALACSSGPPGPGPGGPGPGKAGKAGKVGKAGKTPGEEVVPDAPVAAAEPGAMPVAFPRQQTLDAENGQRVLGIDPYRLEDARKGSLFGISYTDFSVTGKGEWESKVTRVSEATIPNAFILPLPKGEQVRKGDVVVTWWQTGGGMQQGLVTGGSATEPTVWYLGLSDSLDDGKKEHKLAPDSFRKLDQAYEPGSNVAWKVGTEWKWGTILNEAEGKLLLLEGGNTLAVVEKAGTAALPVAPSLKKGDKVHASWMSKLSPATITKVDSARGRIDVTYDDGLTGEAIPYGQIATSLP